MCCVSRAKEEGERETGQNSTHKPQKVGSLDELVEVGCCVRPVDYCQPRRRGLLSLDKKRIFDYE